MLAAKQDEEVMAEINITPFTDVLLVLLIIFIILSAIVTPPGFEKQLSKSNPNNSTSSKNKKDIEVIVNDKGVIYVDGVRTDQVGIYRVMYEAAKKKPNHHVAIVPDVKAPYGIIIRILDAAKNANLQDVGFVTS